MIGRLAISSERHPKSLANLRKGGGRTTPNRVTASVKEAFEQAFEKRGGVPALVAWAREEPSDFYKLYAKLLPANVHLSGHVDLSLVVDLRGAQR